MKKANINMKNIRAFITGNIRYRLYYSKFKWLIRPIIKEQIDWRISIMNTKCYEQGSCVECGCTTTNLQMANKECDKPCYPPIMSKKKWSMFIQGVQVTINKNTWALTKIKFLTDKTTMIKIFKNSELTHIKNIIL